MITNEQIERLKWFAEIYRTKAHVLRVGKGDDDAVSEADEFASCMEAAVETLEQLPVTADGVRLGPHAVVYLIRGTHIDERKLSHVGKHLVGVSEPARYGFCAGTAHQPAAECFFTREAAEQAIKETNG